MKALEKETIQMNTENLAKINETELKIIESTKRYVLNSDDNIKMLSDGIQTLLCDRLEDSLENNTYKALELACAISFICEQKMNFANLECYKNQGC